ncbi:hypothetical protein LBMAG42_41990 [Deltaproteobacteria bacterium]|nr:hypothetical protein LBMAG42_41990 [Deltaproteobacteria bacterium]
MGVYGSVPRRDAALEILIEARRPREGRKQLEVGIHARDGRRARRSRGLSRDAEAPDHHEPPRANQE